MLEFVCVLKKMKEYEVECGVVGLESCVGDRFVCVFMGVYVCRCLCVFVRVCVLYMYVYVCVYVCDRVSE